jgi:O-antigen ligase
LNTTSSSNSLLIGFRTGAESSVGNALGCLPSALCLAASGFWLARPELGPWPLILVALALVVQKLMTHARILSTPFDRPLLLFVLAAALGTWIAYSQQAGWNKFWLIIAGITVYIGILYAPAEINFRGSRRISPVRAFLIILPAAISAYSLLSTDWTPWAQKLPWLTPWRSWITTLRPTFAGYTLHPNAVGGVLAALIPLQLAALLSVKRSAAQTMLGALCLGLSFLGLFLSATRGAWLSLALVLAAWGLWSLSGCAKDRRRSFSDPRARRALWAGALSVVVVMLLVARIATLPRAEMSELVGRLALWRNSLDLALDYPLSGLGLASFEMPYSSYVLLVHVGYLTHAHNLLLDVWLGQGLLGLLALGWLLIVAVRTGQMSPWRNAAFASLAVMLLHGLMDDAFYGYDGRAVVLLFVPFALLARPGAVSEADDRLQATSERRRLNRPAILCGVTAALAVAALLLPGGRALIQANLGTLAQTRTELSAYQWPVWPIQDALRRSPAVDLAPAIAHYQAALALDPRNVTANRRLGQIELSRGQYDAARQHLEAAFAAAPGQRATRQLLGESYAIAGEVERAASLWRTVDTDQGQLTIRQWWYEHIGEAARAQSITEAAKLARPQD